MTYEDMNCFLNFKSKQLNAKVMYFAYFDYNKYLRIITNPISSRITHSNSSARKHTYYA